MSRSAIGSATDRARAAGKRRGTGDFTRSAPFLLVFVLATFCSVENSLGGFTEEPQFGGGATIPMAWGDPDNDGDLDLAVGNFFGQPNALYVNDSGGFTGQTPFGSDNTFAVVWADHDNDGDLDLSVGNGSGQQNRLYVNDGNGNFTGEDQFGANSTVALAWADVELDGDLDLAVGNGILNAIQQNFLYINNGNGTFTGVPMFGMEQTGSLVWGDVNGDFYPDLAVGNGGFTAEGPNALYVNNGNGSFTMRAEFGNGDTASVVWGDYDNDGDLDLAVGNWNGGQNRLYVNDGNGNFTGEDQFGMRDPNTLAWGDSDLDGDLDLAVGNGDFSSADQNYLYINNGDLTFTEQAEFGLGSTDAVAWADYDEDGDLDLAAGNEHSPTDNYLYVNDANSAGWLSLSLVGHFHDLGPGYSNRDGVGAKILVYEQGFIGVPDRLLGFREVEAHGGFSSQNSPGAHFGVPGAAAVDVRIFWPGSNQSRLVQDLLALATGQSHVINESGGQSGVPDSAPAPRPEVGLQVVPNPARLRAGFEIILPEEAMRSLSIFDTAGRLIRTLALEPTGSAGAHRGEWDRRASDGTAVPSGVYFARLTDDRQGKLGARIVILR
jgi:hypothetical protein